jgi:integrase
MAKLFKRGSIWYAWVRKRGGGVKRVTTLCTSRRAAEVVLAQLEREAVDPAYAAAAKATTQRVLDEYLVSRQRLGRSAGTLHHVRTKAGALLGLLPARAADLNHAVLLRYIDKRLAEGAMRTTIKKELRVLKAALSLARKNALFTGEPDAVIPELEDDYRPRKRALTPWELIALVQQLETHRAAHVVFICATGARWSESVKARHSDVATYPRPVVFLHGTKTKASNRMVPLVGLSATMARWAVARAPGRLPMLAPWGNVRRDLAAACKRAGIEPVTPNDLRRTFATWLRDAGVEPQLIGAAMGHTDSRMVERVYGRLTPEALGKLLEERTGGRDERDRMEGPRFGRRKRRPSTEEVGARLRGSVSSAGGLRPLYRGSEHGREEGGEVAGRLMGEASVDQAPPHALSATPNPAESPETACAGTESNRRHGDFQSVAPSRTTDRENEAFRSAHEPTEEGGGRYVCGIASPVRDFCAWHDENEEGNWIGEACGRPAEWWSCLPFVNAPTCGEHRCRCAKRIDKEASVHDTRATGNRLATVASRSKAVGETPDASAGPSPPQGGPGERNKSQQVSRLLLVDDHGPGPCGPYVRGLGVAMAGGR